MQSNVSSSDRVNSASSLQLAWRADEKGVRMRRRVKRVKPLTRRADQRQRVLWRHLARRVVEPSGRRRGAPRARRLARQVVVGELKSRARKNEADARSTLISAQSMQLKRPPKRPDMRSCPTRLQTDGERASGRAGYSAAESKLCLFMKCLSSSRARRQAQAQTRANLLTFSQVQLPQAS